MKHGILEPVAERSGMRSFPHNLSRFQELHKQKGLHVPKLQVVDEWHDYAGLYTVQYLSSLTHNYRATWYRLFQSPRALRWKIIRLLIQLLFTRPVSDAASERIFSSFRTVSKTKRASLSQMTLQDILRNQEEGTLMETYDPSKAVMG